MCLFVEAQLICIIYYVYFMKKYYFKKGITVNDIKRVHIISNHTSSSVAPSSKGSFLLKSKSSMTFLLSSSTLSTPSSSSLFMDKIYR